MASDEQSFTSWKFDWIDALRISVKGRELSVALHLVQSCNKDTKVINPSQEGMAIVLGCDKQTVERAVKALVKEGVVTAQRKTRHGNLHYEFVDAWKDAQLETKAQREECWRQIRASKNDPSELIGGEHENDAEPAPAESGPPIKYDGSPPIKNDDRTPFLNTSGHELEPANEADAA